MIPARAPAQHVLSSRVGQVRLAVQLVASTPSPAPVGQIVTWTATVSGATSTNLWYRFQVGYLGATTGSATPAPHPLRRGYASSAAEFLMFRDYGPVNTLDWTASDQEGYYEIDVWARNNDTAETASATAMFQFLPRASGGSPVISATANPLVFLYSAPACPAGSTMRVEFTAPDGFLQSTPAKDCDGATTMNFYLAGMRAQTQYMVQQVVENTSQTVRGPLLSQTTGSISGTFGPYTLVQSPPGQLPEPILLHARGGFPAATDWMGNVLWYYVATISFLSRPEPGGLFLGWYESQSVDQAHQVLREFDLAGTTIRETNAARVSEQLEAMGMHAINAFHHEVRGLPDGKILALAASERILTDVQGPGPVDVLGDIILVLDPQLQVLWAWDTFDHLDTHRMATLNETCIQAENGCAPIYLAPQANDWTHGNCLELTPDGNILYSSRHQDWLIKIDYENGQGAGDILWRLGNDGDFQIVSSDPNPWFSHQHDANVNANGLLTVFDNGNVRQAADPTAHSRGQALQLDEVNHIATLVLNADLGAFSMALGTAQLLPDGNYNFLLGFLPSDTARAVEVDPSGNFTYVLNIGELEYREFRMSSLYVP